MKMETFLENFELLADAPNGVHKLRELILQLAVQGKLVPQNPNDKQAPIQLENLKIEKERLIRENKIKKSKTSPIKPEEIPFQIPDNWEWVRIGEAMNLINGRAFKPVEWTSSGLPIIRIQNLNNPEAPFNFCDFEVDEKFHVRNSDFLISWSGTPGTSFGAFIWNRGHAILNQHIFRADLFGEEYNNNYLKFAINSRLNEMIAQAHGGVGLKHITKGKLENLILSLPPLEEQKRIVSKVDQLMALCDQLEARQQKKHEKRIRLNNAALDKLLTAPTPEEFAQHWQRIWDNFNLLYDAPETVGQLRQAILQLAVQGKLVAQDEGDEPAAVVMEKIKGENERLVKKSKVFTSIKKESVPFVLPNYWEWTRLGEIAEITMGNSPPGNTYNENGEGVPLINGPVEFSKGPFGLTKKSKFTTKPTKFCEEADLLICVRGSTTGRTNVAGFKACIGRGVAAVHSKVYQPYINYFILSMRQQIYDLGTGSTFPSISQKHLVSFLVPLPPLKEQKRIVAKVDQLMTLCDELEAGLVQAQTEGGELMEAVVHHVLAG